MANIVVVDDDLALRGSMRKILERGGHHVREAEDGEAGLQLVAQAIPDLVVTDLLMPGKEGIETIMELRDRFPQVRILAISGAGDPDGVGGPLVDAELFGAHRTLSKPFSVGTLLEMVDQALDGPADPGDQGAAG
jgi:two-component system, chemotaxis family, chemotaxis protein CheY